MAPKTDLDKNWWVWLIVIGVIWFLAFKFLNIIYI